MAEADYERAFLDASVAVWREVDRQVNEDGEYIGIAASTELRQCERAAWEDYRDQVLDVGRDASTSTVHDTEESERPAPPQSRLDRMRRFNATCGTDGYMSVRGRTAGSLHPDRCICQGSDRTPHKHRDEAPHGCARCVGCESYEPAITDPPQADVPVSLALAARWPE